MTSEFSWNPRAQQPHRSLSRKERLAAHLGQGPAHLATLFDAFAAGPGIAARWRKLRPFPPGLQFRGLGVGTAAEPRLLSRLGGELAELGTDSVLVRIHPWDPATVEAARDFLAEARGAGVDGVAALLQDRRSVTDPGYWRDFLQRVFSVLSPVCEWFEVGHAWNRTKWGVRSRSEYLALAAAARGAAAGHPGVRLAGPAVIDFEPIPFAGALRRGGSLFEAVTSLLYVDRRGAPENTQFGFDLPGKARLLRAAADVLAGSDKPLWVTETNWPLAVPGEYSPTSMTEAVDEETQAAYLARYYLLALGSGMVGRVFWWQAAARGYGLADDSGDDWRRRPAWQAFRFMARTLRGASLEGAEFEGSRRRLVFRTKEGRGVVSAWRVGGVEEWAPGFEVAEVREMDGTAVLPAASGRVTLGPSPRYLFAKG